MTLSSRLDEDTVLSKYWDSIRSTALLTTEEESELARKMKEGGAESTAALRQLAQSNLRLVVQIARRYRGLGLSFIDLIQEGNVGLIEGIKRFDPERGTRLSTCVHWWIRSYIQTALGNTSRAVLHMNHASGKPPPTPLPKTRMAGVTP